MCRASSGDGLGRLDRSGDLRSAGRHAHSTVGTLLREFTFGHARQLESVLREHLVTLCERTDLLAGADQQVFIDIDSLLRPVYGHAKQGASYGHAKVAGKQTLVRGDSAYGNRAVVRAYLRAGAQFSLVMIRNTAV